MKHKIEPSLPGCSTPNNEQQFQHGPRNLPPPLKRMAGDSVNNDFRSQRVPRRMPELTPAPVMPVRENEEDERDDYDPSNDTACKPPVLKRERGYAEGLKIPATSRRPAVVITKRIPQQNIKDGVYDKDFEAEEIQDYRSFEDRCKYLVKWKGWDEKDNTWEPVEHLQKSKVLLCKFYLKRRKEYDQALRYSKYKCSTKVKTENGRHTLDSKHSKVASLPLLPPDPRSIKEIIKEFAEHFPITAKDIRDGVVKFGTTFRKIKIGHSRIQKMVEDALLGVSPENVPHLRKKLVKREIWKRARDLQYHLKDWQNELNRKSERNPSITVENKVDLEYPPEYFVYCNLPIIKDVTTIPVTNRASGCSCESNCYERRDVCCGVAFGTEFAYNRSKRLTVLPGTPIYECNDNCICDDTCSNRVVKDGFKCLKDMHYCIFRTPDRGWGVKTMKAIQKGTFTMLLVGEVITNEEACLRHQSLNQDVGKYLFDVEFYSDSINVIDFSCKGNISHFVNHSCTPNLAAYLNWYNTSDPTVPRIAFYAVADIPPDTELTYSYVNVEEFRARYGHEFELVNPEGFKKCLCGSANCVKYMMFPN